MFSVCAVIPCYNHTSMIEDIVRALLAHMTQVIIVDDGSDSDTRHKLEKLAEQYGKSIMLHRFEENRGKGAAVMQGIRLAAGSGFSHALQIDADGQHDTENIPLLIEHARTFPNKLVTAVPIYDSSVNKGRFVARYITHVWVWINTLSFKIVDSMCGFRIYPLKQALQIIETNKIGERMDFDTEIMVRMYWAGCDIVNVPTRVIYLQNGISHFRMFRDNVLISRMHARLFFGMVPRIPRLLLRNLSRNTEMEQHWSKQQEKGTYLGLKFLFLIYKWLGKSAFTLFLHPVVFFFFIFSPEKRKASGKYLQHLHRMQGKPAKVYWYQIYQHFIAFGYCVLDKLVSWMENELSYNSFEGEQIFKELEQNDSGAVLIGSHLGNLEYCRALSRSATQKTINAVVFTEHAENFNRILKEVNPEFDINLIHVKDFGVDTAIRFREKIVNGEILVIVGDRTSPTTNERDITADFLGEAALFPQGPFILASLMDCPVYLLFCLKEKGGYNIYLEPFRDRISLPRKARQAVLQATIQDYARRLEYFCLKAPLQWFNFFDYWVKNKELE